MNLLIDKADYKIYSFGEDSKGYLIVANNKSIMIDCPNTPICDQLQRYKLPIPEFILHTHIQEEHCYEWNEFSDIPVLVPYGTKEIAIHSKKFYEECKTIWGASREWDHRGEEKYGIAGCITERPPKKSLNVLKTVKSGEIWRWEDMIFEIISLPGHGKHSIGFYLKNHHILFSGDTIKAGGVLVNFFDLEWSYGLLNGYKKLIESLNSIVKLSPAIILPSTGNSIKNVNSECNSLILKLSNILSPLSLRTNEKTANINFQPIREFGRYREILPGLFQNTNSGNIIIFIDSEGRGFMIDPDPCLWFSWEKSCAEFNNDLDLLEREAGLKVVEYLFFTHYHGDHVQFADLLKERYGTLKITTFDIAKRIIHPEQYNLPCLIPWYGFPYDSLSIDIMLDHGQTFQWNEISFFIVHTPGHCNAHAGLFLEWNNQRVACTGDALMYGQGAIEVGLPILYNDTSWPELGVITTLKKLKEFNPHLVIGGHSFAFMDSDGTILDDFIQAATASLAQARKLLDYNLSEGMNIKRITQSENI